MSKRSFLTHITPLPASISRQTAIAQLHDHSSMIELNPLVIRHKQCDPPENASPDEAAHAVWYEITDQINYLPGGAMKGEVVYKACFYNLPTGLQTHVFAPASVDIRAKWSVGGNMPGESREERELGQHEGVPREGLYFREEVDLRCNVFMSGFVRRNMRNSHGQMAERLVEKAKRMQEEGGFPTASEAVKSAPAVGGQQGATTTGGRGDISREQSGMSLPQISSGPGLELGNSTTHYSYVPHCACEGTAHGRSCPLFTPSDVHRQSYFDPPLKPGTLDRPFYAISVPSHSQPSSAGHTPENSNAHELYGSAGMNQCMCTGGVHEDGCMFYPGLRLPVFTPLSAPATPSGLTQSQPLSSLPQPQPRQNTAGPSSGSGHDWIPRPSGEVAELSATRSSVDVEHHRVRHVRDFSRPFRNSG